MKNISLMILSRFARNPVAVAVKRRARKRPGAPPFHNGGYTRGDTTSLKLLEHAHLRTARPGVGGDFGVGRLHRLALDPTHRRHARTPELRHVNVALECVVARLFASVGF